MRTRGGAGCSEGTGQQWTGLKEERLVRFLVTKKNECAGHQKSYSTIEYVVKMEERGLVND